MAVLDAIFQHSSPSLVLLYALISILVAIIVYRVQTDPLKHVPGPLICKITPLWSWIHSYIGDEAVRIDELHKKYGPVVRISPNEVVISEGKALAPIYSEKGGFLKAPFYRNWDSEGHETIFSTTNPKYRGVRSKAVMPIFSTSNIRSRTAEIQLCVDDFITRLHKEADASRRTHKELGRAMPVDVLNLARGMAIDAVTSYCFGKNYEGVKENTNKLTASFYVNSIISVGSFFYFPPWLSIPITTFVQWLQPMSADEDASMTKVSAFTRPLVEQPPRDDTYQSRLLQAGCSHHETDVQVRDAIFAGTDTTGNNLASLVFQLAKRPDVMQRLRKEIAETEAVEGTDYNPQTLKYLDAVVREGLRMSLANPCRFPRQVPPSGFRFTSSDSHTYYLPPGTIVGLQPYTLHFNPEVFPDPHSFKPERWLDATPEMLRDAIPFGLGPRQCVAKNFAMFELCLTLRSIAKSDVLAGARPVAERIESIHWFNAKIVGDKIDIVWE